MAQAKTPRSWDVWFVAADQVYRGVPLDVLIGWAEQGRVAAADRLRPAGTTQAWLTVADLPAVAGFLYAPPPVARPDAGDTAPGDVELEPAPPRSLLHGEEDDEVDMIPLIDISLVLLVFFMMTTVVAAVSSVDLPAMKGAQEVSKEGDSVTLVIDKRASGEPFYAMKVGQAAPAAEDNNLDKPEALIARLEASLAGRQAPPDVRIACHKDLPRGLVRALSQPLDRLQKRELIRSYTADVTEAP